MITKEVNNPKIISTEENEKNIGIQTYGKIKQMLLEYQLVPGQRLVFVDLAKKLGVSRTTINNSLSILANEGFLDFVHNQGYRVHEVTREEAELLSEVRIYLEMCALDKIFSNDNVNITEERLALLEQKSDLYKKNAMEGVSRASFILNEQFHVCYINMAENKYLTDYIREINQKVFIRHRVEGYQMKRTLEVIHEHDAILNALKSRNKDLAKAAIKSHIESGQKYIFEILFSS